MLAQIRSQKRALILPLVAISFGLASCNTSTTDAPVGGASPNGTSSPSASVPSGSSSGTLSLTGAGASFPAPLYQRWFAEYNKVKPDVQISYQSVGSGAGVEQFTKGTVDFGASDTAMKDEEIAKVSKGVVLLPMTAGSIVLAYNLPDVQGLKLPRAVYSDIFLGKIKTWDDPAIAKANPGAKLPKLPIQVVYRSDGSGTTAVFTKHLSAVSADFKTKIGDGKTVQWPVGKGAKGNEGVTAEIQQTQGGIGYIEYGYAKQNNIAMASLENKAGKFIESTPESASKTLASIKLPENLRAFAPDPEGPDSYPIVSYTWMLAYKDYGDAKKSQAIKDMVKWGLTDGQKLSTELGYVPLPAEVTAKVEAAAQTIK
jgi:phosphate transport system substrate-binding protein